MKISLIIISTLLVLSVFLPFLLFVLNGTKNTSNTKKKINSLIKDNGIIYGLKDIWRKKFIGISTDNKIVTFIHFNLNDPIITTINLTDVNQCLIIKNHGKDRDKVIRLKNLSLEFIFKSLAKSNLIVNFFNIDDDLSEDFELQRIEKWQKTISNALTKKSVVKLAS
jgi:hypothetical protein